MTGLFVVKRAYEPATGGDGFRVLVDRIWPRGLSKERAALDLWLKDVAPSAELRKWFGHEPAKFPEFRNRYLAELRENPEPLADLRALGLQHDKVTLVYAAHDEVYNHAVVLLEAVTGSH